MDSTGFTHNATRRALAIPEVATLIFGSECLSRSDLASLCQVSHQISNLATPLLWKNATAEGLFRLILSAELAYWNEPPYIILLDSLASGHDNFEYFHFYGRYVETLEIHNRDADWCYKVEDWYLLWNEMQAQGRPLLPNLKALRFLNTSCSHGLQEIEWISVFATSTLKEVSLAPNLHSGSGAWPILFPIASRMLQTIVNRCPEIETLELAASDDRYPEQTANPNRRAGLAYRCSRPWYQELQHLTRLRNVTISEGWLYPDSLEVLGSLPELGSLTIVPGELDGFNYQSDMDEDLPEGSFPRLTSLSLLGLEGTGMGIILAVTEISRQITKMKIEFGTDDFANDQPYGFKRLFKGLHNSTCLQDLHVSYPCDPEQGDSPTEIFDWIERMGPHHSLEHVRIDGFRIPKRFRRTGSIRRLGSIWPNVQTLSMPSQHASLQNLEDFATLPRLVNLTVKLDLSHPYLPEDSGLEIASLKKLASSGPVRLSSSYKNLSLSARALLALWPLLQQVAWSDEDPVRMKLAEFFNSEVLRFNREFLFGTPPEVARLAARKTAKEKKTPFKLIVEDLEVVDSDSDTCSEEGSDTS